MGNFITFISKNDICVKYLNDTEETVDEFKTTNTRVCVDGEESPEDCNDSFVEGDDDYCERQNCIELVLF